MRIGYNRRVKIRTLRAVQHGRADDDPLGGITVVEVGIIFLAGEGVEAQVIVQGAETGLAAVAVHFLLPVTIGDVTPGTVILRSPLDLVIGVLGADRKTLKLQRR